MIITFNDKQNDKNISLQFSDMTVTEYRRIRWNVFCINKYIAPCFIQSDCNGFVMIEFWTNNLDSIIKAVEYVESGFGVKVI